MNNQLFIEEFKQNFEQLLLEELSIAKDVYIEAKNIAEMLRQEINVQKDIPYNKDGVFYKNGSFEYLISFHKTIEVKWNYYNFMSNSFFQKEYKKIPYKNSLNDNTNTFTITVFAINNNIEIRTVEDTIAHEIEHLYQPIKSGKSFFKRDKDRIAYQNAAINKTSNSNNAIRAIGEIFYFSKNFEQDAQVNGAYAYMMKRYEEEHVIPFLSYKETEAYAVLLKLQQSVEYCYNNVNSNNISGVNLYIKKIYGDYDFKKLIDLGNKAIERLSRKLMRVCGKATIDIEEREMELTKETVIYYK